MNPALLRTLELPRGFVNLGVTHNSWAQNLGVLGDLCWVVAYVCFIRIAFKHKSYGVPFLALCLNITWEFWFTFVYNSSLDKVHFAIYVVWFLLDVVLLVALARYGRERQVLASLREYFWAWLALVLVLSSCGSVMFYWFSGEGWQYVFAYIINLVMSVLFVFMLFNRPDLHGLSRGGAWFKGLGTLLISIGSLVTMLARHQIQWFLVLLYVTIFAFDLLYAVLLELGHARRAKEIASPAPAIP